MRKAVGCAALSCALGLAEAKALKWSNDDGPRWVPAQETQQTMLAYMPSLGMEPPTPTPAPHAAETKARLEARNTDGNTCGYISGTFESSLYCAATGRCVYNSFNFHIGCCDDGTTVCPVWTTCYDSTDRDSFTTNNGLTLWCGDTSYPHCITHLYQDSNLKGYSLLGCAVAAGTGQIWYTPKVSSTSTRRTSVIVSTTSSSSSSSSVASSSSTSSSTPTPTPEPDNNKTPVGPIVGGVVGGLGVIALIIAGVWLLVRQNNRKKAAAAAAAAAASGGAPPPPGPQDPLMAQAPPTAIDPNNPNVHSYYAPATVPTSAPGFVPVVDPRASIAKPPYGNYPDAVSSATSSPPHSPAPPGYQHAHGTPSPPPQQGQFANVAPGQYAQQGAYPAQQQYGQQQQQPQYGQQGYVYGQQQQSPQQQGQQGFAAELSAQRGDGELRELA